MSLHPTEPAAGSAGELVVRRRDGTMIEVTRNANGEWATAIPHEHWEEFQDFLRETRFPVRKGRHTLKGVTIRLPADMPMIMRSLLPLRRYFSCLFCTSVRIIHWST